MSGHSTDAAAVMDAGMGSGRELVNGVRCGSCRPLTMGDYIDRGLRRSRRPMLPVVGAVCEDDEGRFARFSLRLEAGVIADVCFQASPCVTLVAYCELVAELSTGQTLATAVRRSRPTDLSESLPLVPAAKRPRALLASQALIASIVAGTTDTTDTTDTKGTKGTKADLSCPSWLGGELRVTVMSKDARS